MAAAEVAANRAADVAAIPAEEVAATQAWLDLGWPQAAADDAAAADDEDMMAEVAANDVADLAEVADLAAAADPPAAEENPQEPSPWPFTASDRFVYQSWGAHWLNHLDEWEFREYTDTPFWQWLKDCEL